MDKMIKGQPWARLLCIISFVFLLPTFAFSQQASIEDGLTYLGSVQTSSGYWESGITTDYLGTTEVLSTLNLFEHTESLKSFGFTWLKDQQISETEYIVARIYTLGPHSYLPEDLYTLLSYGENTIGWGGNKGYSDNTRGTAMPLLALSIFDIPDISIIYPALDDLLTSRNTDGGWGYDSESESNIYMTALMIKVIIGYKNLIDVQVVQIDSTDYIYDAMTYLINSQNPDGGFGVGSSTVHETALVLDALLLTDQYLGNIILNGITFLSGRQQPDGAWDNDPYSTALALRVLARAKPNLTVKAADIVLTPQNPAVGEPIVIAAQIKNTGAGVATNVPIAFYNGDPFKSGEIIDEQVIFSIPIGGTETVTTTWTAPDIGHYDLIVYADPNNLIKEELEGDNIAGIRQRIYAPADLTIRSLTFDPQFPDLTSDIRVQIEVANLGRTTAENIVLKLFVDELEVYETVISVLMSMEKRIIVIPSLILDNPNPDSLYDITAKIDPDNLIREIDDTNNRATKKLTLGNWIDLIAYPTNVVFSQDNPLAGDFISVTAIITNELPGDAQNVLVRFYDGGPTGQQIGGDQIIETIPGEGYGQTGWLLYDTYGKVGRQTIYVEVDPLNQIKEIDTTNNTAIGHLTVGGRADLIVEDLVFTPETPEEGDRVLVHCLVKNIGSAPADGSIMKIYLGDPEAGGLQLGVDLLVDTLDPNDTYITETISYDTTGEVGDRLFYGKVDTGGEVEESRETNNISAKSLNISQAVNPDLTLTAGDIVFTPSMVVTGDQVILTATIRNLKTIPASDVKVDFNLGDPLDGDVLLGTDTIGYMDGYGLELFQVTWDTTGIKGRYDIYVTIDPDDMITESVDSNNIAFKPIKIRLPQGAAPINLMAMGVSGTDIKIDWEPGTDSALYGITGYHLYRNEQCLTCLQDIAKQGIASASTERNETYGAIGAIDGGEKPNDRQWRSMIREPYPQWWQEEFIVERSIKKIAIYWKGGYYGIDYDILFWNGTEWTTVVAVTENNQTMVAYEFSETVTTDKIRINITKGKRNYVGIYELEIYELKPLESATYIDANLDSDQFRYFVTGLDDEGVETLPSNIGIAYTRESLAPSSPEGARGSVTDFRVEIEWDDNIETDLQGYRIYRTGVNVGHKNRGTNALVGSPDQNKSIDGSVATYESTRWKQIPSEPMMVLFTQPHQIDKIRMYLASGEDIRYQYKIEASLDGKIWETVKDNTNVQVGYICISPRKSRLTSFNLILL